MEFDVSRVYTALNADELKIGSKVIVGNSLANLRSKVEIGGYEVELMKIKPDDSQYRFEPSSDCESNIYSLAYLVSEPDEEKLKWTDLKVGDIIINEEQTSMVTSINHHEDDAVHIYVGGVWFADTALEGWKKVNEND